MLNNLIFSRDKSIFKIEDSLKLAFEKSGVHSRRQILTLVPSSISEDEIHTLRGKLYEAGIHEEIFLPLNVAISPTEGTHLVISSTSDLCDITVIKDQEIIAGGTVTSIERELGRALTQYLREELQLDATPEAIRAARQELTSFFPNDARKYFLGAVDLSTHNYQDESLDARDFFSHALPIYEKLISAIKKILSDVATTDKAEMKLNPIILYGSLFQSPGVIEFFHNELRSGVRILTVNDLAQCLVDVMPNHEIF